jgi:paraquat-inducible protein B
MSKKASPTVIGIFTLVGLILAGVAAVLFGAGKYFENTYPILLHFDQSAYGLQVGSSVRFGGVRIGSVRSINVLVDPEGNRKVIPVVVDLRERDLRLIGSEAGGGIDLTTREGVERAVASGLHAGMKQESLVTGQLYIEFDIQPDAPIFVYQPKRTPEYPVVPTIGTQIDELVAGIADGLAKFNALDIDGLMKELRDVLVGAKQQIAKLDLKAINDNLVEITGDVRVLTGDEKLTRAVENLDAALVQINELATKANQGIEPLLEEVQAVVARTDASLLRIEETTRELSQLSNPRAPVVLQMQDVLRETQRASEALKELSNDLKRNPSSLLRGTATPR